MKQFSVVFEERAEIELNEAFEYYSAISPRLAEKLYQEALNASEVLSKLPHFQIRYKEVRCFLLKNFPYMLHYTLDEENELLKIEAFIHCHRNPDTAWLVNEP